MRKEDGNWGGGHPGLVDSVVYPVLDAGGRVRNRQRGFLLSIGTADLAVASVWLVSDVASTKDRLW